MIHNAINYFSWKSYLNFCVHFELVCLYSHLFCFYPVFYFMVLLQSSISLTLFQGPCYSPLGIYQYVYSVQICCFCNLFIYCRLGKRIHFSLWPRSTNIGEIHLHEDFVILQSNFANFFSSILLSSSIGYI